MPLKKKAVKKVVNKKEVKKQGEITCLTCVRMNRSQYIINGICLTCKQGNRKQELIES